MWRRNAPPRGSSPRAKGFSALRLLAVRQPLQVRRDRVLVITSRYPASSPNRGTPSERAAVASIASRVASGSAFLTANSR
jgi:hypothetical protein